MKVSKPFLLLASVALGTSSCFYNDDYYGQQDPYGYGNTGNYGGGTYQNQPTPGYGNTPPSGYGSSVPSYGSDDVVTIPGDGNSSYAPPSGYSPGYGNAPSTGAPAAPSGGQTYTVQKGDNLYRIGKRHGVTMQSIMQHNGLQSTTIFPGQQLIIP